MNVWYNHKAIPFEIPLVVVKTIRRYEPPNDYEGGNNGKKWFPEVWKEIEINLEVPKSYYPEQKSSDGFYGYQNPDEGYEVRGVRSPCREIKDPKRDSY